jgi:4-hydroxybenzoate polyprenyltransferase
MSFLAGVMLALFIALWCAGLAGFIYGIRHLLPMWLARFKHHEEHRGYTMKALLGFGLQTVAVGLGFLVGWIAERAGGW